MAYKNQKNMPPNEVDSEVDGSQKRWRRPILIFLPILVLAALFLACCGPTIRLVINGCDDLTHFRQPIDVSPLMEIEIPADMDLAAWENKDASINSISESGVHINVVRHSSIEGARFDFERLCSRWSSSDPTYGGEGNEQYCLSYVRTVRSGPGGFCAATGYYRSHIIIQKEDAVIAIFERAREQTSIAKETAIRELAEELSIAARK